MPENDDEILHTLKAIAERQSKLLQAVESALAMFAKPRHMHMHLNGRELALQVSRDPAFDQAMQSLLRELNAGGNA